MSTKPLCWALFCVSAWAQSADTTALDAQAAALKALVKQSPRLNLDKTVFKIQAPSEGWEIGYPSSVAMDSKGDIYVLQRGEKADPLLVGLGEAPRFLPHRVRYAHPPEVVHVTSTTYPRDVGAGQSDPSRCGRGELGHGT